MSVRAAVTVPTQKLSEREGNDSDEDHLFMYIHTYWFEQAVCQHAMQYVFPPECRAAVVVVLPQA